MSKTLSVLIVENFVINEGPKWDRFKRGLKKVGKGAVTAAALGSIALGGRAGYKVYDADRNYKSDIAQNEADYSERFKSLEKEKRNTIKSLDNQKNMNYDLKKSLKDQTWVSTDRSHSDNYNNRDIKNKRIADIRDNQHTQSKQTLAAAGGLAVAPLLAGVYALGGKDDKKKQEKKSLKERLNLVKSGMFLNEESADITALRNRISQGLMLLPGLKGSAADKMEDSIRGWEDQIKELENKEGEKYEK